ncbi:hypothetical protein HQ520_08285, partial [bacterium]|nr:hypothetical protein [bacterium]
YAGANVQGRVWRRGFWRVEARGRRETGITEETLLGLLADISMRWRKLRFSLGGRMEQRDRFDSKRDTYALFLKVAREF